MSSKETKNQNRLYLSALVMLAATAVLSTVTTTGNNVFAQSDSEEDSNGNSDNVADNGNAGEGGNGDTQPDRVGSHDDDSQTSGEGADPDGTVTDPDITGDDETVDEGDTVDADCFGKVIQHEAQEHKEEGSDEGILGEHSRDPVPGDSDNETPRQGIGNQDQGHPAAHGAFNAQFEEEDAENVEENC